MKTKYDKVSLDQLYSRLEDSKHNAENHPTNKEWFIKDSLLVEAAIAKKRALGIKKGKLGVTTYWSRNLKRYVSIPD